MIFGSLISQLDKNVVFPLSFDEVAIGFVKSGPSIEHIILELAFDVLICGKYHFSSSVLVILLEVALVLDPVVF